MPANTYDADVANSIAGTVNNSLESVNVGEGCPAGNMNAAIRVLMAISRQLFNSIPDAATFMPKAGGTFTQDILRETRGAYLHNANPLAVGGKITVQPLGTAMPASPQEGDIVIEY